MENSKGGYIILDISSLLLDETEEATDIEDKVILKQLLSLSDYALRSDLQLKPIYLRAKDKNGINIVSMCELDKNGTQLRIKALISKLVVEILVNYEVEEETQAILIDYAVYNVISDTNKVIKSIESAEEINLSGDLTANSIIENMSGYSFSYQGKEGFTLENVYVGAVKNGNKLTFVIAFNITRTSDDVSGNVVVGTMTIPQSIGEKLYSTLVGSYYYLDNKNLSFWATGWINTVKIAYLSKINDTSITLNLDSGINTITKDTKYYCRYEATFLLSENLISNE